MTVVEGERRISDDQRAAIDGIFAEWDRADSPGCALGIVRDGELVYTRGYGMSNLEHDVPITPDSIFHVASISKQFAAFSIALLADEGALDLDDDVRKHVPELPEYGPTITIRQMVQHTSGIRDQWDLLRLAGWRREDLVTDGDVLDLVGRQKALNFEPGSEYLYSNSGYTLLSIIVKRVSGKTLREFADERIFKPLGMDRTHFHDDHSMIVKGRTQAYLGSDGDYTISIPVFDVAGATSLFTTVEDMCRWDQNFEWQTVGNPVVFETMLRRAVLNDGEEIDYAFGLSHRKYRGLNIVEHSGGDHGYRSHFLRVPEQRFSVICLCNDGSMQPRWLADQVLAVCLAGHMEAEPESDARPSPEEAAQRAGIYRNPRTGDLIKISTGDNGLVLGFEHTTQLTPLSLDCFQIGEDPLSKLDLREYGAVPAIDPALDEYLGSYASAELGARYTFAVDDGTLVLQRRKHVPQPLRAAGEDRFATDNLRIEFLRTGGMINRFTISTFRVRGVEFARE